MRLKNDPIESFKLMLPETTREVDQLRDEVEYFTNQCYKEARRVTLMDYDMARQEFVAMGEMSLRFINELNLRW